MTLLNFILLKSFAYTNRGKHYPRLENKVVLYVNLLIFGSTSLLLASAIYLVT